MEIIERPNLIAVKFLNSIKYESFKTDCINDAEVNGDKKPTEKDMKTWFSILKHFCKTNLKTKGVTKRIYSYSQSTPAGLGGRLFSGGSMQGVWGVYRGLLMRGLGTDIDMKNCHPVLLRYICNLHDIRCPELEYYINHRDECLAEFPSREIGKNTYLVATNSDKIQRRSFSLPSAFKKYDKEMKTIQKKLAELPDYRNLQDTIPEYKLTKNYNGSVINRILCYYENIVLQHALHLVNSKGIEVAILMFDGLMVYGDYYNDENLLKEITEHVCKQLPGLNMEWSYKGHDNTLQIPDDFDASDILTHPYEEVVQKFQKTHAKIINKSIFICETPDEIIMKTKPQMIVSYEHLKFQKIDDENNITTHDFINNWFTDPNIRVYRDVGMYPNPDLCPKDIYNLWRPFAMEQYTTPYVENKNALQAFLNHIKILCNHEEPVYDYIVKWIAQMIQYPETKTIIPTLISKQGAGKGTLIELLRRMFGTKKVFETTDPSRDVWGSFNGIMVNAFLVNLDELSQKDSIDSEGKVKGLITNPAMTINNKGVNQFTITSYHRFIATTNNHNPMKTSDDDRRNLIISSSDELVDNKEYFEKMYEYLGDINVLRTCYDYFKSIPDMDKFNKIPIPKTSYQTNLKQMYKSPLEMWLEDFARRHYDEETVEQLGKETFSDFEQWRKSSNVVYETSSVKLGVALSNIKINNAITKGRHTKNGDTKYFHINVLKEYFKIGLLIDLEETENEKGRNIEVFEIEIDNKTYYTTNENDGIIYITDENGDVSTEVGKFENGVPYLEKTENKKERNVEVLEIDIDNKTDYSTDENDVSTEEEQEPIVSGKLCIDIRTIC